MDRRDWVRNKPQTAQNRHHHSRQRVAGDIQRSTYRKDNAMTKALRNMSETERKNAIERRIANKTMGLGYWAAMDAKKKEAGKK